MPEGKMLKKKYKKAIIPIHLRIAVLSRDNYICQYCGKKGKPSNHYKPKAIEIDEFGRIISFEIDHIIPEFKGGKTVLNNLILACRKCNRSKGDRDATRQNVEQKDKH
jgi:5-methylcytosine-specific restriction endonuclease McrA